MCKEGVSSKEAVPQVGVHFMRFCGKYELNRISDQADVYSKWLNTPYTGNLVEKVNNGTKQYICLRT